MKNIIFPILLYLFFMPSFMSAQDGEPRTHQLSLNLMALLQGRNVDILYQRHQEKGSLRLGLNGTLYTSEVNERDESPSERANYNYNIGLRIGRAFHKKVREFDLYYGADAVLSYRVDQRVIDQESSTDELLVETRNFSRLLEPGLAIQPFLGLNYTINELLSIGLELRSSLGYNIGFNSATREQKITNLISNDVQEETVESGPIQTHSFNLDLINFYGVWLSIHL